MIQLRCTSEEEVESVLARMGELFRNWGCKEAISRMGCVDTEATSSGPTAKLEEDTKAASGNET